MFSTPEFIAALTSAILALLGAFTATFATIKQRQSVKKAEAYKDQAIAELETEKVKLQQMIIDGSYVICPKCGESITLKDVEIKIKEKP